jgi:cob(I)alamin adenosyltransferase
MKERVQALRRLIDLYRRYLAEGVDEELAFKYLNQISNAEFELAIIEKTKDRYAQFH